MIRSLKPVFALVLMLSPTMADADDAKDADIEKIDTALEILGKELKKSLPSNAKSTEILEKITLVSSQIREKLKKHDLTNYIADNMDDLAKELKKTPSLLSNDKIISRSATLAPEVAKAESRLALAATDRWARQLSALIDDASYIKSGEANITSLGTLRSKLEEVEAFQPFSAAARRAASLLALLSKDPLKTVPLSDVANFTSLLIALEKLEASSPLLAIRRRTPALATLLAAHIDAVKADTIASASLDNLAAEIEKKGPRHLVPRIHIVSAKYGKLSGGNSETICTANRQVVESCQLKTNCKLPQDSIANCDGVPAMAFNSASPKTFEVAFDCLTFQQPIWDGLEHLREPMRSDTRTVQLKAGDRIYCRRNPS